MNQERNPEIEGWKWPAPRIYIASLSDYNAGTLFGRWIDAAAEPEELHEAISEVLANSPTPGAEEWAIHDYEGFGPLRLSEYEDIATVSRVAKGIERYGEPFVHWVCAIGADQLDNIEAFEEAYIGKYDSTVAYAEELFDGMGLREALYSAVPDSVRPYVYVDADAFARDMQLSGEIVVADGSEGVYIFDMTP